MTGNRMPLCVSRFISQSEMASRNIEMDLVTRLARSLIRSSAESGWVFTGRILCSWFAKPRNCDRGIIIRLFLKMPIHLRSKRTATADRSSRSTGASLDITKYLFLDQACRTQATERFLSNLRNHWSNTTPQIPHSTLEKVFPSTLMSSPELSGSGDTECGRPRRQPTIF